MKRDSLLIRKDILKEKKKTSGINGEPPRHFPPGGKIRMATGW